MTPIPGATRDWVEHGFTCRLRKEIEVQVDQAFERLITECRKSSDSNVTRRLADYEQMRSFLAQLGREMIDASDDGDD